MSAKPTYEKLEKRVKELEKEVFNYKLADEAMGKRTQQIVHNQMVLLELAKMDYSDLESALKEITKVDAETLSIERVSAWFFNGDRSEIVCENLYNLSKKFHERGLRLQAKQYPRYFRALEESRIVAADDAHTDPCTNEFTETYLKPRGITSMMDVPIRLHGEVVGVVCHEHTGPMREWTLEEQDFVASIADMVSLAMEASEHKHIQEALRESEAKYRSLIDNYNAPITVCDSDGITLVMNRAAAANFGGEPEDFIGKGIYEYLPDEADFIIERFRNVIESGKGANFEDMFQFPSGKMWFWSNIQPARDTSGKTYGALIISHDITERKQTEEALKESEEKYRSLFDSSINPTSLLDRDGVFLMMNQAAARLLGGSPDDFIGKSIYKVLPENAEDLTEKHRQVFESGVGTEFEVMLELPPGKRWFLSTGHPIRDAGGRRFAIQIISYDITDRKRAEEAIKESAEKIKLFAYSVSHDLKTPVIGIYGLTKLLHKNYKDILDEKGRNYCDQILKASEQLAVLVEQINIYISTKESPLTIESVNLRQVFKMVRDEFSIQINIRRINWSEPENMPEVNVDRLSVLRVLRNFVDNALKYGGDELAEINMGYEESGNFHILSVKDDGAGIAEEDSKKIFGLFERNVTSRGIEGTGLGLAIAKEIAEKHNGKVWAEPGRGKGTIFYISISKDMEIS